MGTLTNLLTFEEFERLPDQPGKRELLKGELNESPAAEVRLSRIAHRVFQRLVGALTEAHGCGAVSSLGEAFHEMGYKLSDGSWVQPDVSITRSGQPVGRYFGDSPAIAVEIISPSTNAEALVMKTELYFQWGANEAWLVYPKTRHVIVYADGAGRVVRANETLTTPLLPAFAMSVAEILGE